MDKPLSGLGPPTEPLERLVAIVSSYLIPSSKLGVNFFKRLPYALKAILYTSDSDKFCNKSICHQNFFYLSKIQKLAFRSGTPYTLLRWGLCFWCKMNLPGIPYAEHCMKGRSISKLPTDHAVATLILPYSQETARTFLDHTPRTSCHPDF